MEKGKKTTQGKQEALHSDTFTVIIIVLTQPPCQKVSKGTDFSSLPQALVPGSSHTSDLVQN